MGKTRLALITVALLAVASGIFWYQARNPQQTSFSGSPRVSNQEPSSAVVVVGGNAVNVESQEGGDTIAVDLVVLAEPGFVVIHNSTKDGKPGEVVGHSELLSKGENKAVVLDIDPQATKGDIYFAMLHADINKDEDFGGTEEDFPLKDNTGNIIMMKFAINSDATPAVEEE